VTAQAGAWWWRSYRGGDEVALVDCWNRAMPADRLNVERFVRTTVLDPGFDRRGLLQAFDPAGRLCGFVQATAGSAPRRAGRSAGSAASGAGPSAGSAASGAGPPAGSAASGAGPPAGGEGDGWVVAWAVDPAWQRRGLGRSLLERAERHLVAEGCRRVVLLAYPPGYYLPGIDATRYPAAERLARAAGYRLDEVVAAMESPLGGYRCPGEVETAQAALRSDGWRVGPVRPADVSGLLHLAGTLSADWAEVLRAALARGVAAESIQVAGRNGEVAGFAAFGSYLGFPDRFGPFGVDPRWRGVGLGRILLHRCLQEMGAQGMQRAWFLWTSEDSAAGRLYEGTGFTVTRRFDIYSRPLVPDPGGLAPGRHALATGGDGVALGEDGAPASPPAPPAGRPLRRGPSALRVGLDRVLAGEIASLTAGAHRRLGWLANGSAVSSADLVWGPLAARRAGLEVVQLFAGEHGPHGAVGEGHPLSDSLDPVTKLPVCSLYGQGADGSSRLGEAVARCDAVVVDVVDLGARYSTYLATAVDLLAAAADARVPVVVLDRPNPLGRRREGPNPAPGVRSIVGRLDLPIRHGLTLGEALSWHAATEGVGVDLEVVGVAGRHSEAPPVAGSYLPPSPNLNCLSAQLLYPGTCLVEGTDLSEGRGTALPFQVLGAPCLDAEAVAETLRAGEPPGVGIRCVRFTPQAGKHAGEVCAGLALHVSDPEALRPVALGVALLSAVLAVRPATQLVGGDEGSARFLDLLWGSDALARYLMAGCPPAQRPVTTVDPAVNASLDAWLASRS